MPGIFGHHLDYERVMMEQLQVGMRITDPPVGSYAAQQTELIRRIEDMSWELRTYMLAEHIDDIEVSEFRRVEHECLRFESWWDHFKATYRGRWWMRWRRWVVRYHIENHPLTAHVKADLTRYWAYPQANVPVPELGEPLRWAITHRRPIRKYDDPVFWSRREDHGTEGRE